MALKKIIFLLCFLLSISGLLSSAWALFLGITLAMCFSAPFDMKFTKKFQTNLLQISIVGMGAGMNISTILHQGIRSIPITFFALVSIMCFGMFITRKFGFSKNFSWLLSSGTAICGGSAIATIAPVIGANDEEVSLSLGLVFVLNAIALFLFPLIGNTFGMTQENFGIFSALSIHDTSSVVAAANQFGSRALEIATTTKLVRALWILPLALSIVYFNRLDKNSSNQKATFPKFILFFIFMSAFVSLAPQSSESNSFFENIARYSKQILVGAIFLIGIQINPRNLKKLGFKTFIPAISLWIFSIFISFLVLNIHF